MIHVAICPQLIPINIQNCTRYIVRASDLAIDMKSAEQELQAGGKKIKKNNQKRSKKVMDATLSRAKGSFLGFNCNESDDNKILKVGTYSNGRQSWIYFDQNQSGNNGAVKSQMTSFAEQSTSFVQLNSEEEVCAVLLMASLFTLFILCCWKKNIPLKSSLLSIISNNQIEIIIF